jgi:exopolyphosphatase / guanosine-5'-triphosphate,3'-diphosphate pyrophosphatase
MPVLAKIRLEMAKVSNLKFDFNFAKWGKRSPRDRLIAVIDIGSNSVRMVVYQGLRRNPRIIFNERVLCGLGRNVSRKGKMGKGAVRLAISTLQRFSLLCHDMKVDDVKAVATAAVRDAANGAGFVDDIKTLCGFNVMIIDGEKEARLSAYGVISGFPKTSGIIGDLGGGSLELIRVEDSKVVECVTLPIGPLRLLGKEAVFGSRHLAVIKDAIAGVPWLRSAPVEAFYMVGGAWRAIMRLQMDQSGYPLNVLHSYKVERSRLTEFAREVAATAPENIKRLPEISKRRIPILPLAAAILVEIMEVVSTPCAVSSDNGIREGILYKMLNHQLRRQDPFIAACKDLADQTARFPEHADNLMKWMDPIFEGESSEDNRLRFASCMLGDIGWQGHPDFRAELAFDRVLYGRFSGLDHRGRAIVALAIYLTYGGPFSGDRAHIARAVLDGESILTARRIGAALRLGQRMTGGTARPLEHTSLRLDGRKIVLGIPEEYKGLAGVSVKGRFDTLCNLTDRVGKIRIF